MKKQQILAAVSTGLISLGLVGSADAALVSRLGGLAYYDNQLDVTWAQDANIVNGRMDWNTATAWAAGLTIAGVSGWHLPDMDKNNDDTIVNCSSGAQAACADNEYGYLYYYGAGTTLGGGVTPASPGPFSNVQDAFYLSSTEFGPNPSNVARFNFGNGAQGFGSKVITFYGWAVHSGDVSAVPVPAAVWLFGSGLLGLIGVARRKKA